MSPSPDGELCPSPPNRSQTTESLRLKTLKNPRQSPKNSPGTEHPKADHHVWSNKRGIVIGIYVLTSIPILAVAGFGYWLYTDLYQTSAQFESKIEQGQGIEIPVTPSDFARFVELKKSDDATIPFLAVAKEWEALPESDRNLIVAQVRLFATSVEGNDPKQAQAFVKAQPFLAKLRNVAACKDSHFERDWTGNTELIEPHYHTTIQFGRLLCAAALAEARINNTDTAFQHLETLRKLAAHISRDAGLDGTVTHVNLETQALTAAQEILYRFGRRTNAYSKYQSFIANRKTQPNIIRNLEGEAMRTTYVLSQANSFKDRMFSGTKLSIKNETFQRAATVRMTEFWTNAIAEAEASYPDTIAIRDAYVETLSAFSGQRSPSRVIPSAIAEWNVDRINLAAALEVRYALAKPVGEVIAHFHLTGNFPKSLSEINFQDSDPYTRDVFIYQRMEKGFRIYSTGADRIDDGGDFADQNQVTDIVTTFDGELFKIEGI